MNSISGGYKFFFSKELVIDLETNKGEFFYGGPEAKGVVEEGGGLVLGMGLDNGEEIAHALEFAVGEAKGLEEIESANLKPLEIFCVIGDALGIGFGISNFDNRIVSYHGSGV